MEALEFKSKIQKGKVQIPKHIKNQLSYNENKNVRVILLIEDEELVEDKAFQNLASEKFFEGYAKSDEIYDNE